MKKTPRPYQTEAVNALLTNVYDDIPNPCLVLPTGAGKSFIMGLFIRQCRERWGIRVMVAAHVRELLLQDAAAIEEATRDSETHTTIGIYSAGLNQRKTHTDVVVAGVQSAFKHADRFGQIHVLLIDECHLVNPRSQGRYNKLIEGLTKANPRLRVIGLTATPFRMNCGSIVGEDRIFTDIIYEVPVKHLIDNGWLCPVVPYRGTGSADLSEVRVRGGEFVESDLAKAFDIDELNYQITKDVLDRAQDRESILVFAAGRVHAEHLALCFASFGEKSVEVVDGETNSTDRVRCVDAIKSGELRILINIGVFTTGFDAPNLDCIVLARATQSLTLYCQIIGRGMRTSANKVDCLLLDYGDNVQRHGPIPEIDWKQRLEGAEPVGGRVCPDCERICSYQIPACPCGMKFPPVEPGDPAWAKLNPNDAAKDPLATYEPHEVSVRDLKTSRHLGKEYADPAGNLMKKPDTLKATYIYKGDDGCMGTVSQWLSFDKPPGSWAHNEALKWGEAHGNGVVGNLDQALAANWNVPSHITIKQDGRYMKILEHRFEQQNLELL